MKIIRRGGNYFQNIGTAPEKAP